MRSRTVREGSVGLMILAGVGLFGGLVLWIRGLNPANQSFTVYAEFAAINGVQAGTAVRYRGVNVGRIESITPGPNGVEAKLRIERADVAIPKDSDLSVNQVSLLGETVLDIMPRRAIPETAVLAGPLDRNCDRELILCQNSRLRGAIGVSTDELIRATTRFAETYSSPQFTGDIKALAKNSSEAASEITRLSREVTGLVRTARGEVRTFSATARSIANTADQATLTITQVNDLITANRSTLVTTLDNLSATSSDIRASVARISPLLNQVEGSSLLRNLETLSANAAQTSANLRDVTGTLNNPTTITLLQQTLDSARATFENTQKITSDLDELTGDPKLRENLKRLINGLSGLVSSTQQLEQQAQVAQILAAPTSQVVAPQTALKAIDPNALKTIDPNTLKAIKPNTSTSPKE